jgi:hypothetical protein
VIVPEKSQFPLKAKPQTILIDEAKVALFHKAFRESEAYIPPTLGAIALKGVFEIVDSLQVDWRKLLHATQQFTYHSPVPIPCRARGESKLMDCKLRAGMFWLSFVTELVEEESNKILITSKSLIMVRAE